MRPIARSPLVLRAALLGGVAVAALAGAAPARAEVGVASAVNVDARGRPPGAAPRVISLGSNVVFKEEITTDAAGLVQILLLDGTTFTVGPNSQLTIDEFVYNPDTGDAKVVASLTKGVFRFVGARTSQTEGGATVKTPVGTIGIRGGVANFSCDGSECTASLVAGKSLTIVDGGGSQRVVYETGYTAVISKGPGGGTTTTVRKATAAEVRAFQQQLASKPGQTGGTSNPPSDATVAQSQVGETNSGQYPNTMPVPGSIKPVQSSEPDQVEEVAGIDGKTQDDLDNDIAEEQPNARVLTAPATYNAFFGDSYSDAGVRGLVGSTPQSDQSFKLAVAGNRLVSSGGSLDLPDYSGSQGDTGLEAIDIGPGGNCYPLACDTASFQANPLGGTAYAGAGDFVAYMLGFNGDPTQPVYIIYGTPTPDAVLTSTLESGFNVRRYTLTSDPIQNVPVPFFSNQLYGSGFGAGSYHSSDLFILEPGNSSTGETLAFQSWVSIEGAGATQRSAAFVNTSDVYRDGSGELVMTSGRRGSFRDAVTGEATNMRGGISTLAGATGSHFFGPDAEHFVIGSDASIDRPDTYFDGHNGPALSDPYGVGYFQDGHFATHHVADLVQTSPLTGLTRSYGLAGPQQFQGFMAGMGESSVGGSDNPYRLTSSSGPNLTVTFDAVDNTFAAQGTVYDAYDEDAVVQNMLLTFGRSGADFGQSAYVDDAYYGAINNEVAETNQLVDDNNQALAETPGQSAGSYIVSGRANPIVGYQHLEGCSDCEFIQWGWWGTRLSTGPENASRQDYVHMGTWVSGDVSAGIDQNLPVGQLPFGGSATYTGTAIGTVSRDTGMDNILDATYIASGTFDMNYDFAARNGDFNLDIDGMNLGSAWGGITGQGPNNSAQELFAGNISNGYLDGSVSGAFVDGPNVAAGAIGQFNFAGYDYGGSNSNVAVSGTFAGKGQAQNP